MHGQSPGFAALLNAEVDSMGGVVDGGVSLETKTLPHQVAIEKAQAELRLEYDVREERRRELEFLEKGGNPLDFKFCPPASISVQSTSLADQPLENEAKGSFALATSPQGDSVESSGRPGNIEVRESNIADNLLLFDGENKNLDGERNSIRTGKRKKPTSVQQSPKMDGSHSAKGLEDTSILHLGVRSQAYARRNRSKSNREGVHTSATDSATSGHINRSSILHSSLSNANDAKVPPAEAHMDDRATCIPNLKQSSSYENNVSTTFVSDNMLSTELVTVGQPHELHTDIAEVPKSRAEVKTSEKSQEVKGRELFIQAGGEQVPSGTSPPDLIDDKQIVPLNLTQAPLDISRHKESVVEAGAVDDTKDLSRDVSFRDEDQASGRSSAQSVMNDSTLNNIEAEPSHAEVNVDVNVNGTNIKCLSVGPDGSSNKDVKEQNPACEDDRLLAREHANLRTVGEGSNAGNETNISNSHVQVKEEELCDERLDVQNEAKSGSNSEGTKADIDISQPGGNHPCSVPDTSVVNEKAICSEAPNASTLVSPIHEPSGASLIRKSSASTPELQSTIGNNLKLSKKAHEDAILKDARIIQGKRKRAGELPMCNFSLRRQWKSHWDYVLEEMAWLANDFMQERLWKITAAAQICHKIALIGQSKFVMNNLCRKQRTVARGLAKAVIEFWLTAEKHKELAEEDLGNHLRLPIQRYAIRLLQSNSSSVQIVPAEAPRTPERITDAGSLEMSWDDQFPEECLFYKIPHGSSQVYRESVETHWLHYEKMGINMRQVDCEVSTSDLAAEFKSQENALDDDEDDTVMYYKHRAYEGNTLPKISHKKKKTFQQKFGVPGSYETGFDLPYISSLDNKMGTQQSSLLGKRPGTLNVGSIPTKRVRTAARQRIVGPFSATTPGAVQMTSKTDVSSGDTNSFQDDQCSLQGVSQRKNSEFESTMDFEKQLPYDGAEVSTKPKKKKKPKYLGYKSPSSPNDCGYLAPGKGSVYERKWPMDSFAQIDQDLPKRKLETHHFESNGTSGAYVQHAAKKPKPLKQLPEVSPEAAAPTSGPIPSPAASQMSNMSNSNKLISVISNRDRGRKSKVQKGVAGQLGSGGAWSVFEDQALVVLVHDMGPNWELVSDAINSTLRFKCIFRKPKECKERHKVLMDKSSGDGADSAEDSGSSQPYPSTLPGIPKGSARQLFQRLQGPMEEDTLKAHFEKIIALGQKLHPRRSQKDTQELKQISTVHNSHMLALSQACPNNLAGGPLTPLDLCDASASNTDVLGLGYQGPHTNGLSLPSHQGPVPPILPHSNANTMLQGSPGMIMGNSFPSPSSALNAPARDSPRYGVPRSSSLPIDDQQRMQYNLLLSGRTVPLPLATDRGVRMVSGGNGMGMMCGMNRNVPVPRPGFQGIGSPGVNMVSSSGMLSSNGVGLPGAANVHPSSVSNQGSSMMRSRDTLPMLRNPEDHRQMIMQELQMQATQGNGQAVGPFNGTSSPYSNQTIPPAAQTFPVQQHQHPHQIPQGPQQPPHLGNPHHPNIQGANHTNPQQQAYAMRLAKERQLQQRLLHQPQPFPNSSAMTPIQNNSQPQQPTQPSSPLQPISPSSQHKQPNLPRNPQASGTLPNQIMKQRQRQQLQQQQTRQQPQQLQSAQHQSKLMKGVSRGNVLMHQNVSVDTSHINGGATAPGNQALEKQMVQQSQTSYSGSSGLNTSLPQPLNPQKMYSRPPPQSSKQISPMPSHADNSNQGQVQATKHSIQAPQQPPVPSLPLANQHQQQRQVNQPHQTMRRVMLHQNRQLSSDGSIQAAADAVQVNQMIPVTPATQSTDSASVNSDVNSGPPAASHWKPESSFESSAPTPTANLANSPQTNLVGGMDPLIPSSSQGLPQRQFSGSYSARGHALGGPWQQQQQHQLQQPPTPHQQLHRQAGQGTLYGRPSNPGPG